MRSGVSPAPSGKAEHAPPGLRPNLLASVVMRCVQIALPYPASPWPRPRTPDLARPEFRPPRQSNAFG